MRRAIIAPGVLNLVLLPLAFWTCTACATAREGWDIGADGVFPYTDSIIPPVHLDRHKARWALEREYVRRGLHERGLQGRVLIICFIDVEGRVVETGVAMSSGNEELDQAALRVGRTYRFRPAIQKGEPIATHVYVGVDFEVRR